VLVGSTEFQHDSKSSLFCNDKDKLSRLHNEEQQNSPRIYQEIMNKKGRTDKIF
jgi:hypothetical protein